MEMGFFLQNERIFPGAHKIGAAISGPRIADKKIYGHEVLLCLIVSLQLASRVASANREQHAHCELRGWQNRSCRDNCRGLTQQHSACSDSIAQEWPEHGWQT